MCIYKYISVTSKIKLVLGLPVLSKFPWESARLINNLLRVPNFMLYIIESGIGASFLQEIVFVDSPVMRSGIDKMAYRSRMEDSVHNYHRKACFSYERSESL